MRGNFSHNRPLALITITDDNPRTEDAALVRKDIMAACGENTIEIADRKLAIEQAVADLKDGDILLLAGKGHEDYQIIGTEKHPMDEKDIVTNCIRGQRYV